MADIVMHDLGGGGPELLLVHGLTEDGSTFPDAVERWAGRWHLLSVDLRGHGVSPRFGGDQLQRTPEVWEADLVDVLTELSRPVVLGHSLGGLMALRAATRHPGLVRALVLEDPALSVGSWTPSAAFSEAQLDFLDAFATAEQLERERARMRVESRWSVAEIDAWAASKPRVDRRMIQRGLFLGDADQRLCLERVAVPTLLIAPDDSDMAPEPGSIANPLVTLKHLEGVGHCVRRDDPARFFALVDAFLAPLVQEQP